MYRTDAYLGLINSVLDSLSWTHSAEWLSLKLKKQDLPLGDKSPRVVVPLNHHTDFLCMRGPILSARRHGRP